MMWLRSSLLLALLSALPSHAFFGPPTKPAVSKARTALAILRSVKVNQQPEDNFLLSDFALYNGEIVDPYHTLQVDRQASVSTIKKAYHRLCRHCHPDAVRQTTADDVSRQEWERITWSYKLLSDPKQRRKYDMHHAVAHPGETLQRAAKALVWISVTVLAEGLTQMSKMAEVAMTEYQKHQQYQARLAPAAVGLEGNHHNNLIHQHEQPQSKSSFIFKAIAKGFTNFCRTMVASFMGDPYIEQQQETPQAVYNKSTHAAKSMSPPHDVLTKGSSPQPLSDVTKHQDVSKNTIKWFKFW